MPLERDHLAVEPVQRAEAELAVLGQLGEAEVALVGALEQGADRRGLEEDVGIALGVQFALAHRLDVKRPDPALVKHGGSLPSAATRREDSHASIGVWQRSNCVAL
ncbi:MAG TPA: hypothetical protein VGF09_08335 [Solirubrobacterales bacterium]|jgi:hypothetical protein